MIFRLDKRELWKSFYQNLDHTHLSQKKFYLCVMYSSHSRKEKTFQGPRGAGSFGV